MVTRELLMASTRFIEPAKRWILVNGDTTDVCIKDPGKEVDVYLTTDVRTMIQLWMGEADSGATVRAWHRPVNNRG